MIYIETLEPGALSVNEDEVLRYLGYGKNQPEGKVKEQITSVTNEIVLAANCRACFTVTDIAVQQNTVDFGAFSVFSKSLSKNLKGAKQAVLFAATVGTEVDRIIGKYAKLSPASSVIAQASGAAAIESFCNLLCLSLKEKFRKNNLFLRPRFSPGYGDFDLSYQKELFSVLDCTRKIGVSLTESLMMTPTKSVTAVIGIGERDENCHTEGCEICEKRKTCDYARG